MIPNDERLQLALAALDRNRAVMRARFKPAEQGSEGPASSFPRSATLRWLMTAVGNKWLVSAAAQVLLRKHPIGRVLAAWAMGLRS